MHLFFFFYFLKKDLITSFTQVSSEPLPGCFQENALTYYSFNDRGIVDEKIDLTGIQNMNMNEISLVLRCSIVRSNMDTNEEATKYEDIHIDVQSSQFENEVLERNAKIKKLVMSIMFKLLI